MQEKRGALNSYPDNKGQKSHANKETIAGLAEVSSAWISVDLDVDLAQAGEGVHHYHLGLGMGHGGVIDNIT